MIIFPATGVFENLGPMGVSMFFVSAVVAQLVYTFGGSGFGGANGSMMIEVVVSICVPFPYSVFSLEGSARRLTLRSHFLALLPHPGQQHREPDRRRRSQSDHRYHSSCIRSQLDPHR